MFEEMTYEKIMERMLSRVPDALDKREVRLYLMHLHRQHLKCLFFILN